MNKLNNKQSERLQSFTTVSGQIRYLHSLEFTRSEIQTKIKLCGLNRNIRYQHVRNVLITPIKNPKEKY